MIMRKKRQRFTPEEEIARRLTAHDAIYLLHHHDKAAIAESPGIVGAIALIRALPYAKAKLVDWRTVFTSGLPGMAGTYLGAWIAVFVPGYTHGFGRRRRRATTDILARHPERTALTHERM